MLPGRTIWALQNRSVCVVLRKVRCPAAGLPPAGSQTSYQNRPVWVPSGFEP